jgi:hypothetical protein
MVRDVIRNNGDSSLFLPMEIHQPIAMAQQELQKK